MFSHYCFLGFFKIEPYSCYIRPFIYFISCDVTVYLLTCFVVFEDRQFVMMCTVFPKERFFILFSFHHLLFCNEVLVILGVWFCYLHICLLINKSCTVKGTFFLNHDLLGIYILLSHHVCFVYLMMLFQLCSSE